MTHCEKGLANVEAGFAKYEESKCRPWSLDRRQTAELVASLDMLWQLTKVWFWDVLAGRFAMVDSA